MLVLREVFYKALPSLLRCGAPTGCGGTSHFSPTFGSASWRSSKLQEVEKEVWEKDASGKQRLKRVQETEYCYEADMEGACACESAS